MRAGLAGLATPHPLADTLPGILREDAFARGLCGAFDEVLAPVLLSLDAFTAMLDLATTPTDLLPWYAHWVAVPVTPGADPEQLRELVAGANAMHARRGTAAGIAAAVEAAVGAPVEVVESGGADWSDVAGGELPGALDPTVTVTARPGPGVVVDPDTLAAVVRGVTPAHVTISVQVVSEV